MKDSIYDFCLTVITSRAVGAGLAMLFSEDESFAALLGDDVAYNGTSNEQAIHQAKAEQCIDKISERDRYVF